MIGSYALGIAAVIGLMLCWVAVQAAWSKAFPEAAGDVDVLAGRRSCHGCGCSSACERKLGSVAAKEKRP